MARRFISFCLYFPLLGLAAPAPDDPEAERAAFKLRDGYEVNLFASEADGVVKPIQMRFDHDWSLWVACSTGYPQPKPDEKPQDKIIVLEDRNRDGRADKTTVFADGLLLPTGLEHGDGGLYVGSATELLHFADTNGDLHADVRRVVLHGFGTGDSHQNINSFCWSPGGQLFMSQGLHAFSDVETPNGIARLHQAGIWRFTPQELRLEPFFGDGMTPHNPWGFVWDDWFQPFMVAGNGDGIYYLPPCLVSSSHRHEFQRIFKQGNKYCGVDIVGTRHLPDDLQGKLIAGGFMNNRIVVFRIEDEGSGFSAKEETPLLVSSDVSFRPVDVKVGPDGAIYVADWYNSIIGHYQASFRDPRRDKAHGRIWRITAKDRPLKPKLALANASATELLNQLTLSGRWVRYQARRVLSSRGANEVLPVVQRWMESLSPTNSLYERYLLEALATYEMFDVPETNVLNRLLTAKDARARAYATEVVGRWHGRLSEPLMLLARSAQDEHPRVRLQAVVAASRIPQERSIEVALSAVDRPVDRFLNDALVQTVFALKPHWQPAFTAGHLAFAGKPNRLEFLLKTDASPDTLKATVDRLADKTLDRETRGALLSVLANVGGPQELATVLSAKSYVDGSGQYDFDLHGRLLPQLAVAYDVRKVKPAGNLEEALLPLLQRSAKGQETEVGTNVALPADALRLAGKWRIGRLRKFIEEVAELSSSYDAVRSAALEGLANFGDTNALALLHRVANSSASQRVIGAAITGELMIDQALAAQDAARFFSRSVDDGIADVVFSAFLQRPKSLGALARAFTTAHPNADAAKIGLHRMSAAGRTDEPLLSVLIDAAGLQREKKQLSTTEIAALADEVRKNGRAENGAQIYARSELNCSACHTINGIGGNIGPDLSALGTAQPIEFIVGAILYPNREVKEGFSAVEITTKSGEDHQGYVAREDAQQIVLKDIALNREIRLAKSDIAARQQRGSVMPEGLADTLTRAEFRDLIRYLSELGR